MDNTGELQILLDHEDGVIRAKTWLKGKIQVEVKQGFVVQKGSTLTVEVIGKEISFLLPTSSKPGVPAFEMSEHVIFQEKQILHEHNSDVEISSKDSLSYPFSVYMPGTVPPTMQFENGAGSCRVEYHVKAKFSLSPSSSSANSGNGESVDAWRQKRMLDVIGQPLSSKQHPYHMDEPLLIPLVTHAATSPSLISRLLPHSEPPSPDPNAFVAIGVKIDNTHVGKGKDQLLELTLAGRYLITSAKESENISSCVESMQIKLFESIEWMSSAAKAAQEANKDQSFLGPKEQVNLELSSSEVNGDQLANVIKDVSAHTPDESGGGVQLNMLQKMLENLTHHHKTKDVPRPKVDESLSSQIHAELAVLEDNPGRVQLEIPGRTRDSYDGVLIKVSHFLRVTLVPRLRLPGAPEALEDISSMTIPIQVFQQALLMSDSSTHHTPSKDKISEVKTTAWPGEVETTPDRPAAKKHIQSIVEDE